MSAGVRRGEWPESDRIARNSVKTNLVIYFISLRPAVFVTSGLLFRKQWRGKNHWNG